MTEFTSADLRPAEVEAYLRSRNWEFLREVTNGSIWVAPPDIDETLNVFVPRRTDFGDYVRRLREVVHAVSEAERRPEQEIIRDLVETSADVIRFRLPFTFPDASIRLTDAMTLFQRAKATLRAAALAAHRPSVPAYRQARIPGQSTSFFANCASGTPSREASWFLSSRPSAGSKPHRTKSCRTDEPFGRFAVLRLTSALSAVEEALESAPTKNLLPFTDAVADGVSANLCLAISELTRITGAEEDDEDGLAVDRDRGELVTVTPRSR